MKPPPETEGVLVECSEVVCMKFKVVIQQDMDSRFNMSATSQESRGITPENAMTPEDVIDFYTKMEHLGVEIWIDGGWGVDALLGEQTRVHGDLDMVIQQKDVPKALELLKKQGYGDVPRPDTSPWNFVMGDDEGHEIDFHVIVFDDEGNGICGPVEKGAIFPAGSLSGTGTIGGHTVRCITPEHMVRFHTGYEPRENDFKDVHALCKRFGIDLPEGYR